MIPTPTRRGVLILAGGRGERFWPWSTPERPKQLLPLATAGRTLLAATFARALRLTTADQVVVMTSEALREACQRECPGAVILGEPMMRNTAPAIAGAAYRFAEDQAFAVLPADHAIDDEAGFTADMERAFALAERDAVLVTFGIPATAPEPNFGYIQHGALLGDRLARVARFTEKPTREVAAGWLAAGGYSWNSGMFVWQRRTFFAALSAHHPDIAALRDWGAGVEPEAFAAAIRPAFEPLKSISVDYAVLEHAPNTVVLEASFDWDDLGSWQAWARRQPRDAAGNVCWGDAVPVECKDCIVVGDGLLAAPLGLTGMVVVATRNGVLACRIEDSEQVRKVSEAVRARKTT